MQALEAKQRAKEEAKATMARFTAVRTTKTDCTKIAAKVGPMRMEYGMLVKDKAYDHAPALVNNRVEQAKTPLAKLETSASQKLHDESPATFTESLTEVGELCQTMKAAMVMLRDFLETTRKAL